jgi:hypothetical protein
MACPPLAIDFFTPRGLFGPTILGHQLHGVVGVDMNAQVAVLGHIIVNTGD